MTEIRREVTPHFNVTCSSAAGSTSGRFPYGPFAGGIVHIASTGGCTQINWFAGITHGGTGRQVYSDGAAVTTAVTVGAHPIPDALFGAQFVIPIATGATTAGMQITVGLKG